MRIYRDINWGQDPLTSVKEREQMLLQQIDGARVSNRKGDTLKSLRMAEDRRTGERH